MDVAGWVDIRPGAAAEAADKLELSGTVTGDDLGKALAEVKPDFVVDVTIPEAHRDVTLQALAAGVPVLGEKPMADSMEHAREMVAASEKAGKLYMVSQSRRYDARIHAYRKLIEEQIGQLGILNSDFYIGAHFGGFRDEMASVLLLDMAIHTLDQARYRVGRGPGLGLLRGVQPGLELVQRRSQRDGSVRDDRRPALHLPRVVVQRGQEHVLGVRLARGRAEGHGGLGRDRGAVGGRRDQDGRVLQRDRAARH